ncbi:hypothetical protein SBA7_850004 [Candidatus Sulfotelmatobacter sp. SbA7]|nr:hypothetical protein SBA7_850004 [Candidatus Sulfotelmatobacter sp. SbA7]
MRHDHVGDSAGHGRVGVAEQGGRISHAEVNIAIAVHVEQAGVLGLRGEYRIGAGPLAHPVQGNTVHQVVASALMQGSRFWVSFAESGFLACPEEANAGRVNPVRSRLLSG